MNLSAAIKKGSPIRLPFFIGLIMFALTVIFSRGVWHLEQSALLAPPPEHIEYFAFGFRDSLADSLWLRWIQDSDKCQTYKGVARDEAVPSAPSVFEGLRHKYCDNSWGFKMLDAVTRLAPRFKMPYEAGAITLSVLTEDYAGATVIFNRAVREFPDDWTILYRAAFHFLFDVHDLPRAAQLLEQAGKHGAPFWVHFLAVKIYSKSGQLQLGLATLLDYRKTVLNNPKLLAFVDQKIAALNRKLQQEEHKGP